jgi:hypothetical protein
MHNELDADLLIDQFILDVGREINQVAIKWIGFIAFDTPAPILLFAKGGPEFNILRLIFGGNCPNGRHPEMYTYHWL